MPRNYTAVTIKTLFGEASTCAHPECDEPLIFQERGKTTVVAEIAHIRSETPGGPRHDPDYNGDPNGPENLLLLCGKHHRAVDRHERTYPIVELEAWKRDQRANAHGGTPLSQDDLRAYARLSDQERIALAEVARRAQRVTHACRIVQRGVDEVRAQAEEARRDLNARVPIWTTNDDGTPVRVQTELPFVQQREWQQRAQAVRDAHREAIDEALGALDAELAVLRMWAADLTPACEQVSRTGSAVPSHLGDADAVESSARVLADTVARLWKLASGEVDAEV